MRRLLLALPLLLSAGCETYRSDPYAPVEDVRYTAIGHDPFWMVTIGDDRIVLRTAQEGGMEARNYGDAVFARTLPRTVDGVTTWESGDGIAVISIEARPGPCEGASGRRYADHVRVRLSGREMTGCGGRLLTGRRG